MLGKIKIHRCCMSLEVEASSNQSLVIKVNGVILKFTIRTFALITGLNCVGVVENFKFNTEEPNRLIVQYFGGNEIIRRSNLFDRFNGVQTEPHHDIDKQAFSEQNSGDDFVNPLPPSMKVTCKRKKGQSVSPTKRVRKKDSNIADQMERNEQIDPVAKQNVKKAALPKVVRKKQKLCSKKTTARTYVPTKDSQIPSNNINNHNAVEGPQHFTSPVVSENQNQRLFDDEKTECDESSNDGIKEVFQVDCDNSPVRNLITVDAGFSSAKSIIPSSSMESQNKISPIHTPLSAHRVRRPDPFNTSPYLTSFGSSAGTSLVQPIIFELKHPFIFDLISDNRDIIMWDAHQSLIHEGLLAKHENKRHDQDRYKKGKARIPVPFDFGVDIVDNKIVDNKNWFYNLYSKGQLLNDSHINVIFYYLRKKAKYDVDSRYKYTTVDCVFTSKILSTWKKYEDLDSDVCCADEEHFIGDYIRWYKVHAGIPWHLVDHVFIPVNVKEKFHWALAVLSLNDRRVYVYDSYRAAGHDAAIRKEVTKLAQLIPLKLTMYDYYKNIGLDRSVSQEENESFEIAFFIDNIPQQTDGSLDCGIYMLAFAEWLSYDQGNSSGIFDVMFLRSRYASLLWNYAQQKQDNGAISDTEAPPRHTMPQSVRVVSAPIEIQ
ncbi:uncharacterized protein LOC107024627 [Solanum pennellii]|uniref:Uncharacterized protein LOC107024627 n=1 Tax=Solanum pennellii TaxID=28526 RepID=A0ABM1V1V4_SOLPN|nr:uncharacterized protein LOC107024627 [Solanum pennellii]